MFRFIVIFIFPIYSLQLCSWSQKKSNPFQHSCSDFATFFICLTFLLVLLTHICPIHHDLQKIQIFFIICLMLAARSYSYVPSCRGLGLRPKCQSFLRSGKENQFTPKDIAVIPFNGVVQSKMWGLYSSALSSKGVKSILTKTFSSFIAFLVGDYLSQMFQNTREVFNFVRFIRMGVFGALIHAPFGHYFYRNLEKRFPGSGGMTVVKKVLIDQLVYTPLFATVFFMYSGLAAGWPWHKVVTAVRTGKALVTFMSISYLIWPVTHFINFTAVPSNKRLLFINIVQLYFNMLIAGLGASFLKGL